jgi:hypothetical protein
MKGCCFLFALLASAFVPSFLHAKPLSELEVLYVGSERSEQFTRFLNGKVAQIETRERRGFNPGDAEPFDVILLDWPQGEETREMRKLTSPLGRRDAWHKPTVLLGSAGLNLAVAWKLKGGSGCTCMDPLAYDLRDHEIFDRPFKIDRAKKVRIPTPKDFKPELKEPEIEVLPLVTDYQKSWAAGWCSYSYDFGRYPDVEFFCGGVNHKTPTAAGCWRQGNLLHFGFEQSPMEMNDEGRKLLLNAIAYISRFTEDRPIAVTPSVFAGPVAKSRVGFVRNLRHEEYKLEWIKDAIAPELWSKELSSLSREKMIAWMEENGRYLHPKANQQLELDADLVAAGVSFDQPAFFGWAVANLRRGGAAAEHASRLLERYVPIGPKTADPEQWKMWWQDNEPYAFASDSSDYRWYVDPLAKKRGVPTAELRGEKRADIGGDVGER